MAGRQDPRADKPTDLREACVAEALQIVRSEGLESLSLRELARRLNVSHQAPYKHFPSRDHLLAEIVARAFDAFARHLDAVAATGDPARDLREMGRAYLAYAEDHPLEYRLMFTTPWPDPTAHPDLLAKARHAFSLLTETLRGLPSQTGARRREADVAQDALFIWSMLHGFASLHGSQLPTAMALDAATLSAAAPEMLARIGRAIGKP